MYSGNINVLSMKIHTPSLIDIKILTLKGSGLFYNLTFFTIPSHPKYTARYFTITYT